MHCRKNYSTKWYLSVGTLTVSYRYELQHLLGYLSQCDLSSQQVQLFLLYRTKYHSGREYKIRLVVISESKRVLYSRSEW